MLTLILHRITKKKEIENKLTSNTLEKLDKAQEREEDHPRQIPVRNPAR